MIAVPDILKLGERLKNLRLTYKKQGFESELKPTWELSCEDESEKIVHERKGRLIRDLNLDDLGKICSEERFELWGEKKTKHGDRFNQGFAYILGHPLQDENWVTQSRKTIQELNGEEKKRTLDSIIDNMYCLGVLNEGMKGDDSFFLSPAKIRIDKRLGFLETYHDILSELETLCEGTESQPLESIRKYINELRNTKGGVFVPTAVEGARNHLKLNLEITHSVGYGYSFRFTRSRYGTRVPGIRILKHLGHRVKAKIFFMFPYRSKVDSALKNLIRANREDIEGTLSLLPALEFYRCGVNYERKLGEKAKEITFPEISLDEVAIRDLKHPLTSLNGDGVVPNNYDSSSKERILLVTGANNGGKTFYSKAIGLAQLLFQRGLSIPAKSAQLKLTDDVYTHFVAQDDPIHGEGRYRFELRRMCEILENCTNRSLVIVDEPCSGTEPEMGQVQSSYFVEALSEAGSHVIFTTHFHGLAKLNDRIASIRNIHPDTEFNDGKLAYNYKMLDGPAGTSYALEVAQSMDLGREALLEKVRRR